MSSPAEPQHDPTMEEILASIRKIISEDQPEPAGAKPAQFRAQAAAKVDVLELTEELPPEETTSAVPPAAAPASVETKKPVDNRENLISDSSREAIDRAIESLDKVSEEYSSFAGAMLENVFARAVQDAVTPTVQEWVNTHQTELVDAMKPMIRAWMDDHLPRLVENVLKQELGRAVTEHLRSRLS
jgi:cell pole-organizing protein PopZ